MEETPQTLHAHLRQSAQVVEEFRAPAAVAAVQRAWCVHRALRPAGLLPCTRCGLRLVATAPLRPECPCLYLPATAALSF